MMLTEVYKGIEEEHYEIKSTKQNILYAGIWWPTLHKYAKEYCQACDLFQRVGN
jgi:hypothetical protein